MNIEGKYLKHKLENIEDETKRQRKYGEYISMDLEEEREQAFKEFLRYIDDI